LEWLYDWLCENKGHYNESKKVLEFGCGVTSWVLNNALKPEIHVAMEAHEPCIKDTIEHVPDIQIIKTTWDDIPKIPYDIIFVDASTNPPKGLKTFRKRAWRDDAVKYVEDFQADDALIILHDWSYRGAWLRPRKYLEAKEYPLIAHFSARYGLGIYQVKK